MLTVQQTILSTPLFLAPMAGVTHSALRTLVVACGGVGMLSTEMLSARRIPMENQYISPYLVRTDAETPLSYQLLVTDVCEVAPAFAALHRFSADAIDLNFGCPAPRVRKAGGGSSLMADLEKVQHIVRTARMETSLPLSAKIRLGERLDEQLLRDFCVMLEDEGLDLLTIHARLRRESFARKPRWEWVRKVKDWLTIPVVANGGIFSVDDADRCLVRSNADGLMLGRAAAQMPWLFADIARKMYKIDIPPHNMSLPKMYEKFVLGLLRFRPERRLGRLKEFTHYFARNYPFGHHLAMSVQKSATLVQGWQHAVLFFENTDQEGLAQMNIDAVTRSLGG